MQLLLGDSFATLKTLPDQSVQTCVTSPPYYGLRDYGVDGQLGLEDTPEEYIERTVAVFREVRRVLKDNGTLWLNLGDSYAGSCKGQRGVPRSPVQLANRGSYPGTTAKPYYKSAGLKPKDLIGIPWRVAFALQADGWYLRQDIIWHKQAVMPESVGDRCTKAHEYIFLLSKSRRYYFDADAIKEPLKSDPEALRKRMEHAKRKQMHEQLSDSRVMRIDRYATTATPYMPTARNKRSVWTVNPKPYKGAHFATYPPDLIRPCILAGAPTQHTVLDPFMGSGTTGYVALSLQRNFIGIELNPAYIALAKERIGALGLSSREHEALTTTQQGKVA